MRLLGLLALFLCLNVEAATYYVRADGTAVAKAGATSSASASTSMSRAVFNSETFSAGDFVYVSGLGGNYTGTFTIPSDGITLTCDPASRPTIVLPVSTTGIDNNGKYGTISCFTINNADFRPAVWIKDTGSTSETTIVSDIISDHSDSASNSATYAGIQIDDTTQLVYLLNSSVSHHRTYGIRVSGATFFYADGITLLGNNEAGCTNVSSNNDQFHIRLGTDGTTQNGTVFVKNSSASGGCGGSSSDFDIGRCSVKCTVTSNVSINPEGRCFSSVATGTSISEFSGNVCIMTAAGTAGTSGATSRNGFRFYTAASSTMTVSAFNNTVYVFPGVSDVYGMALGGSSSSMVMNITLKNNVFDVEDGVAIHLEDKSNATMTMTSDYNALNGVLSHNTASAFYTTVPIALATWQGSWDANSLTPSDFGYVNKSSGTSTGLRLKSSSVLRRAGKDLNIGNYQDAGNRAFAHPPSIGAWEAASGDIAATRTAASTRTTATNRTVATTRTNRD